MSKAAVQTTERTAIQALREFDETFFTDLDEVGGILREAVTAAAASAKPSSYLRMALAMQALREAITADVIWYLRKLQGTPLGFFTDKDKVKVNGSWEKGPGYDDDTLRDVTVWAFGQGARMVGNEINILSERGYLTKNYFERRLNEVLGFGNHSRVHEIPRTAEKGAIVVTHLRWLDPKNGWQEKSLTHGIKGDDKYASTDLYAGKADRKVWCWLLGQVEGRVFDDGEVDPATMARNVTPPVESPLEQPKAAKTPAVAPAEPEEAEFTLDATPAEPMSFSGLSRLLHEAGLREAAVVRVLRTMDPPMLLDGEGLGNLTSEQMAYVAENLDELRAIIEQG